VITTLAPAAWSRHSKARTTASRLALDRATRRPPLGRCAPLQPQPLEDCILGVRRGSIDVRYPGAEGHAEVRTDLGNGPSEPPAMSKPPEARANEKLLHLQTSRGVAHDRPAHHLVSDGVFDLDQVNRMAPRILRIPFDDDKVRLGSWFNDGGLAVIGNPRLQQPIRPISVWQAAEAAIPPEGTPAMGEAESFARLVGANQRDRMTSSADDEAAGRRSGHRSWSSCRRSRTRPAPCRLGQGFCGRR
jgi:hypothetical protein